MINELKDYLSLLLFDIIITTSEGKKEKILINKKILLYIND